MARLFTTHPTGIWVHCDKGHKTCGLPVNIYQTRVPRSPPRGRWAGPVGRGSVLEGKLQYLVGVFVCHLEPVRSTCGWAMSGLIGIKALNPSLQGKQKNRFQLYAILEKAKQWRQ